MKTYGFILLMAISGAVACSANAGGGNTPPPPADSGTPPADTGSTPTDTGSSTPTDRGTTPRDTGSTMNAPCSATIPRLCMCGMNASCQQMALMGNQTCAQCLGGAITSCCPTEVTNLSNCAQAMMCGQNDQACWQMRCPMEFNALNQCNSTSQMQAQMTGSGACYDAYVGCFGQFPITCM